MDVLITQINLKKALNWLKSRTSKVISLLTVRFLFDLCPFHSHSLENHPFLLLRAAYLRP